MNEEEQRQEALDELFSPDAPTEREKARLEKKSEKARLKAEKKKAKAENKENKEDDTAKTSDIEDVSDEETSDEETSNEETSEDDEEYLSARQRRKLERKRRNKEKNKPENINIVKELVNLLVYILAVMLLCWLILTFVGQRTEVSGNSMNDTLTDGDSLWINKFTYLFDEPERYDIVVFPAKDDDDKYYIKRIIGLPGETVWIGEDGLVYINGKPLEDDTYGKELIDETRRGIAATEITVPENCYFVLGDNRNNSRDSRVIGCISDGDIIGKAVFRFSKDFGKIE
jgi:signal peptidase I